MQSLSIINISFIIIGKLIKKSKTKVAEKIDILLQLFQEYLNLEETQQWEPYLIYCVYCLFLSKPNRVIQEMEFLLNTISQGLSSTQIQSYYYASKLLRKIGKYDPSILPEIWSDMMGLILQHDITNSYQKLKNKEITSEYVSEVVPSFKTLTILIRYVPEISQNEELTNNLYEILKFDLFSSQKALLRGVTCKLYAELAIKTPENENILTFRDHVLEYFLQNPDNEKVLSSFSRLVANFGTGFLNEREYDLISSLFEYTNTKINQFTGESELNSKFAMKMSRFFAVVLEKSEDEGKVNEIISQHLENIMNYVMNEGTTFQFLGLSLVKTIINIEKLPEELFQPIMENCLSYMKGIALSVIFLIFQKKNEFIEPSHQIIIQYFIENHESLGRFDIENLMSIIAFMTSLNEELISYDGLLPLILKQYPIRCDFQCNIQCMPYLVLAQNHLSQDLLIPYLKAIARTYARPITYFPQLCIPQECTPPLLGFLLQASTANGGTTFLLTLFDNNRKLYDIFLHTVSSFQE